MVNSVKSSSRARFCGAGSESGSAAIVIFIVLIVASAGMFAYKTGKLDTLKQTVAVKTAAIVQADAETTPKEDPVNNPVIAKVGSDKVTRQEVINLVNSMPEQMRQIPLEQLFPMALEQIINNKIIDKNAAKANLGNDKDIKNQLKVAKEQLVRAKFLENSIKAEMTDDVVKASYDKYVADFPKAEEVKVAHILVEDEAAAKDIINKLNGGADFAELAKENSKDGSAANGGDLGYFTKDEVVPEFAEAAFATKDGEYTKEPVKTAFGYHIINVGEKRMRPPADFASARTFLEQELQRGILDAIIKELREDVQIERFDINGKPLPAANVQEQEPAAGGAEVSVGLEAKASETAPEAAAAGTAADVAPEAADVAPE